MAATGSHCYCPGCFTWQRMAVTSSSSLSSEKPDGDCTPKSAAFLLLGVFKCFWSSDFIILNNSLHHVQQIRTISHIELQKLDLENNLIFITPSQLETQLKIS